MSRRTAVLRLAAVVAAVGVWDPGLSHATTPTPTASATATHSRTAAPTNAPTPSPTEFFPACCLNNTCPTLCPTPTQTEAPATPVACVGDCNGDRFVSINELITAVNIDLGGDSDDACPAFTCNSGPLVYIDCLIIAVHNALNGCQPSTTLPTPTPSPVPPELSLGVEASVFPDQHQVAVVATLSHLGGSVVSYVLGCTGECSPKFYLPISFDLSGPDGEVFLENPCGPAALCAEFLEELSPGGSLQQTLSVTGTAWEQHESYPGACDGCTQTQLAPGHYTVTARFSYRIGRDWAEPEQELTQTATFDWPPWPRLELPIHLSQARLCRPWSA